MARTVKCQRCGISDTVKDDLEFELVGEKKPQKKYYHKSCYQEHLKDKAFKEKERKELDELIEVIKDIYGAKVIPNNIYPYLQDLRNGTRFFGKRDYKYKQGYSYELIKETFEYTSETIQYWNARKDFNGLTSALRYGLAIVCDKLHTVEERKNKAERQKMMLEKFVKQDELEGQEYATTYKKPSKSKSDITEFLDD